MADPFDSVRAKIGRAKKHIDEIGKLVEPVEKREVTIVPENDAPANRVHLRVAFDDSFDHQTVSVIAGDCLHDLRSALDHLVSGLAAYKAPNRTDDERWRNQFPICSSSNDLKSQIGRGRLNGCPSLDTETLVERLQPYNAGYEDLGILADLNNIDKHRALTMLAMAVGNMAAVGSVTVGFSEHSIVVYSCDRPLKNGAIFISYDLASVRDYLSTDMEMKGHGTLAIRFQEASAESEDIREVLNRILKLIESEIVPAFIKLL